MELKSDDRFFLGWSILGAIGLVTIWHLPWRFQVNDDVIMMWLVSGAYTGETESYAVFLNPILSWFFSLLYSRLPEVNWYGGLWFWVVGLSFFLLVKIVSRWQADYWLKSWFALFLLLMTFHFCFFPQFTLVAGFSGFASLAWWFSEGTRRSIFFNVLSILLFIASVLIRWESVALIGMGLVTAEVVIPGSKLIGGNLKKPMLLALLFLSIVGAKFLWEANSPYLEFLKFSKLRSGVIDHPNFRQEVIEKKYAPGTDFYFFSHWYFEGYRPTGSELAAKKKELDSEYFSLQQFGSSVQRLWSFQKIEAFKSFLILCVLLFFLSATSRSPKLFRFFLIWTGLFIMFNYFFLLHGRVIILFFLCFLFPLFFGYPPGFDQRVSKTAVFLSLALFSVHCLNFSSEARGRAVMDQEFSKLLVMVDQNVPIFIEGYYEHNSEIHYTIHHQVPFLTYGWISRSSFQQKAFRRFGLGSFEELEEYVLITPTVNTKIVFPDYINHTLGKFRMKNFTRTDNFFFLHFQKR